VAQNICVSWATIERDWICMHGFLHTEQSHKFAFSPGVIGIVRIYTCRYRIVMKRGVA
jgi:hypothetical protein